MKIEGSAIAVSAEETLSVMENLRICNLRTLRRYEREVAPISSYQRSSVIFGYPDKDTFSYFIPEDENGEHPDLLLINIIIEPPIFRVRLLAEEIIAGYRPLFQRYGNWSQLRSESYEGMGSVYKELYWLAENAHREKSRKCWGV